MLDPNSAISDEYRRFEVALPDLLSRHAGKWVVFFRGEVASIHDDHDSALRWALDRWGMDEPYVIAPIEEPRVLGGSCLFDWSRA